MINWPDFSVRESGEQVFLANSVSVWNSFYHNLLQNIIWAEFEHKHQLHVKGLKPCWTDLWHTGLLFLSAIQQLDETNQAMQSRHIHCIKGIISSAITVNNGNNKLLHVWFDSLITTNDLEDITEETHLASNTDIFSFKNPGEI